MEMEKTPAARAMEWSIEFEKGIRSRKPGQSFESIKKLGQRLVEWNKGPKHTVTMCNMFDMVPGEERLFADGILLRLATTFASGDKDTRICVVKAFYSTFRRCGKKGRGEYLILTMMSLDNKRELLRRIRAVFYDGDVESRALCLICFGCLSIIAKGVPEVQYIILSSLRSSHVLEMKASLFAAGCISELSNDFAAFFLETLINIITVPSTSLVLRLAAMRTFVKLGNFRSLARKAHKVGSELVLKYPEEELSIAMAISLTKIAINSMPLIFEQFGLLFSFLNQTTTLPLRATALRCIHYILKRKGYHILISGFSSENLFKLLYEADLPSSLRCEALKIILLVISYMSSDVLLMHVHELEKLLMLSENSTVSKFVSESLLEMHVIVKMSCKLNGRIETAGGEVFPDHLSRVASLFCDRLAELMKLVLSHNWRFDMVKQLKILLKLLLHLVNGQPQLASFMVEKLCSVILYNVTDRGMGVDSTISTSEVHVVVGEGDKNLERFMFLLYRFFTVCLESLHEAGAATTVVFCRLKNLVSFVCQCSLFSCSTHTLYTLLLYPVANWTYVLSEASTDNVQHTPINLVGNYPEIECFITECPRNILAGDKWFAYVAGKYAACNGSWSIANSIFENLYVSTPSGAYSRWLRALAQLGYSERCAHSLFMKVGSSGSLNHVLSGEFIKELVAICDGLSSTEKMLAVNGTPNQTFCFQRWFLVLRRKGLEALVDILKLLCSVQLGKDDQIASPDSLMPLEQMSQLQCFLDGISSKLERAAGECDLLASSFFDMDSKSLKVISTLALSCSLLAFSIGFAYFYPNSSALEESTSCASKGSGYCLHVALVQNLMGRLCHTDSDSCVTLMSLLRSDGLHKACFHSQPRFPMSRTGSQPVMIRRACRNAVEAVACLQESMEGQTQDGLLRATQNGTQVLMNVIKDWIHFTFQLPTYFFKVRSCIGAFLFVSGFNSKSGAEPVIPQGSHLSLNLCLRLENVPLDLISHLKKVHCILHCKTSTLIRPHREPSGQKLIDHRAWTTDTMLHMHEKLRSYVLSTGDSIDDRVSSGHEVVEACISFVTNGTRQAFSTCLLDVSAFRVGSYKIQWHSSCVDGRGLYSTVLPLNDGPAFTIAKP
ncbi:Integrator complex subunit 7-like protein [Drosera capensis]